MLFDKGKLEKLTLRAFKPGSSGEDKPIVSDLPDDTYVLQVNPGTYTLNKSIVYSRLTGQGDTATESLYKHTPPASLSFEFLFDGTGVVPEPSELGDVPLVGAIASKLSGAKKFEVIHEIRRFDRLVHEFDGKIHRPRELLLVWGTLAFPCVLTSASYRYTLFRPDGSPLRAIASCSFCEHVPRTMAERKKNPTSPDLTHLRDVRDGDTLPAMANEVYGKPELYLEVARVNKLVNFRRLRSASRVAFPPVGVKS
ncbi:MAG TPA: hypothetical protein VM146_07075 [Steroidobacteraceae bacterium]|nr:hypothetical protein [Steroidobacteraceae bacterium]